MRETGTSFIVGVGLLAGAVLMSSLGDVTPVGVGAVAPDFSVKKLSGEAERLHDYAGSVVFLNFWATDCVPCAAEMPDMEVLHRTFKHRKFHIMPISRDFDPETVAQFYKDRNLTMSAYLDPGRNVYDKYRVRATPETFIIDGDGKIIQYFIGQQPWSDPSMIAFFDALLTGQRLHKKAGNF